MAATPHSAPQVLRGYNLLANLMAEQSDLAIYRRFMPARHFDLMLQQADIMAHLSSLGETKIEDMLQTGNEASSFDLDFGKLWKSRSKATDDSQWTLLMELREKLRVYGESQLQMYKIMKLPKCNSDVLSTLQAWMTHDKGGKKFLKHLEADVWRSETSHDLTSLDDHGSEQDPLSKFLEGKALTWLNNLGLYRLRDQSISISDPFMPGSKVDTRLDVYSDGTVRTTVGILSMMLSSLLPTTSIFVLYYVQNQLTRLWLILVFTMISSAVVMLVTHAKRAESFAVAAAFAAVQVVFVSGNAVDGSSN